MVALNTWTPDLPATYRGPRHASSRIDFILIQQRDGDPTAKHVSYLQDLPHMMGLHEDHQPMLCGIRRFYHHSKPQGLSRMQQQTLQYHWAQDTQDWRALLANLQNELALWDPHSPDPNALNATLLDACRTFRPSHRPAQDGWLTKWQWALAHPPAPSWKPTTRRQLLDFLQGWQWVTHEQVEETDSYSCPSPS